MLAILMGTPLLGAQPQPDAEAIRLNNRGVALMGQQFTERAAESFAAGIQEGPKAGAGRDQRGYRAVRAAKAGRCQIVSAQGHRARSQQSAGVVQPWSGATREQPTRRCVWPAFSKRRSSIPETWTRSISRALATRRWASTTKRLQPSRRRSRSIRCMRRLNSRWRARCNAPDTHRGGKGTLQGFPAPDQHQDLVGPWFGVWRAGALLDGDSR